MNRGFKFVKHNKDLRTKFRKSLKNIELNVYVDAQMVEGESEVAAVVGGGHPVVEGDSEVGEGVPIGAGDAGGDVGDGEGDDFVDSNHELGVEDVGRVEDEGRTEE
ncbi:hypothetical protein Salat_2097000 [Sesamum alatum]|uniref:Uncharacterized protein n=1 Tax=Sesamum alatum TaxID=300844 RepID=A0AAE1Y0M6_9LAMI|nr:hypothetical protein Salat_2097000 [Sesamum alatum]